MGLRINERCTIEYYMITFVFNHTKTFKFEVVAQQMKVGRTWRDGHVVFFRVAPSHRPHAVEAVGCDDGVGLGEGCEGRRGCGGGLREAQRGRGLGCRL